VFFVCATVSIVIVLAIVYELIHQGYPTITNWFRHGFGMTWKGEFGAIPLIWQTFYAGIGSTIIATVLGIPTAIYLAEFANNRLRNIIKPSLEVLTGLPSIVMGLVAITIVAQTINGVLSRAGGVGMLTLWLVVGVMSIPTVASISADAIKMVSRELKEASLGLGATRWQTMTNVLVPVAMPGILAAILLGMGNAIGETMAAYLILGSGEPELSLDLFSATNTIPTIIMQGAVADHAVDFGPLHALGFVLFFIIGAINLMIRASVKRGKTKGQQTQRR